MMWQKYFAGKNIFVANSSGIASPNSPEIFKYFMNGREVFICLVTKSKQKIG